jgi:imidazole glycerol phosphate synthase glutamine amidotransferase subunit
MIGIVDWRLGNIGSLLNAFDYLGAPVKLVSSPAELDGYDAVVLPGVGAFDTAMTSLRDTGFDIAVRTYAASGRPVLGICLGLQVLCSGSDEGSEAGLGLVDGRVENLRALGCAGKVPHVGFNSIQNISGQSAFLSSMIGHDYYFVHSFALQSVDTGSGPISLAFSEYEGPKFVAALHRGNIFATQFHPEKSGEAGLELLKTFLACSRSV